MAKTKISEFDLTPANNTDIDGINIAEGCAPSGINNAIRELMSQLKAQQDGSSGDPFTITGTLTAANVVASGTVSLTGTVTATTQNAGTNNTTLATTAFVTAANTAERTATATLTNKTLTSPTINTPTISGGTITGITDLTVADGGTGRSTLTDKAVLIGAGTSGIDSVSPGTSGNVLASDGTNWSSAALSSLAAFDKSLAASGYQKFPGGLVLQWGSSSSVSAGSSLAITFPTAFASAVRSIQLTIISGSPDNGLLAPQAASGSTTGFTIVNKDPDSSCTVYWFAIGY